MSVRGNTATSPAASSRRAPSGAQWEITYREQRALIVEVGGGIRSYSVDGRDILDGYSVDQMCSAGRGQVLIPWPNRIGDGSYEFGGCHHQLPLTEPEHSNAIHGLVRWANWTGSQISADHVIVEYLLHPQSGYPYMLELRIDYRLSAEGLRVRTTARNIGSEPCPFGSGAHPYLTAGTDVVDDTILCAPGATVLLSDQRGIPVAERSVAGTDYDFLRPRQIGSVRLDHCFTDLVRDQAGRARVELAAPEQGPRIKLWVDPAYTHLMLFTGDPIDEINRRSLAVEPMTCPPDAFRSGDGYITLEPGAAWVGEWGIGPYLADVP